jgi:endonuclease/exonuclease/phosphatase family metal-dependent hydrolase
MTFNIRNPTGSQATGIPHWPERSPLAIRTIQDAAPDIVGLQEAHLDQVTTLLAGLGPARWTSYGRGRDGSSAPGAGESVSILYRIDRLERVDQGHFWLSENPDAPASAWAGMSPVRIVTWIRLRVSNTSTTFYVYNTHFPSGHAASDARYRFMAAQLLAARVASRANPQDPFFILGDFNATPEEDPLRYLRGERGCVPNVTPAATCAMYDAQPPPVSTRDTYTVAHPQGSEGTLCSNRASAEVNRRIDFVLMSSASSGSSFSVVPEGTAIIPPGPAGCASDHRPVIARVEIR